MSSPIPSRSSRGAPRMLFGRAGLTLRDRWPETSRRKLGACLARPLCERLGEVYPSLGSILRCFRLCPRGGPCVPKALWSCQQPLYVPRSPHRCSDSRLLWGCTSVCPIFIKFPAHFNFSFYAYGFLAWISYRFCVGFFSPDLESSSTHVSYVCVPLFGEAQWPFRCRHLSHLRWIRVGCSSLAVIPYFLQLVLWSFAISCKILFKGFTFLCSPYFYI